jgi:hypothetical protein
MCGRLDECQELLLGCGWVLLDIYTGIYYIYTRYSSITIIRGRQRTEMEWNNVMRERERREVLVD